MSIGAWYYKIIVCSATMSEQEPVLKPRLGPEATGDTQGLGTDSPQRESLSAGYQAASQAQHSRPSQGTHVLYYGATVQAIDVSLTHVDFRVEVGFLSLPGAHSTEIHAIAARICIAILCGPMKFDSQFIIQSMACGRKSFLY